MKETEEPSIVKKSERAVDDFIGLWKKRWGICALLMIGFLSAPTIAIVGNFWGLPAVKGERDTAQKERNELRQERDALKNQLAPWQALAASIYTNAPPDKRLDLLLERVETLSKNIQDTVNRLSPSPRVLSPEAITRIKAHLDAAPTTHVEISYEPNDSEALALANQIKGIFESSNCKVTKFDWATHIPQTKGIAIQGRSPSLNVNRVLGEAIQTLFEELHSPVIGNKNSQIAEGAIGIHVGVNVTRQN